MSKALLSFKNVSKSYSGNKVLSNISIEIGEGEIHALIGENGAGKSTLMNILFGMPVIHNTGGFDGTVEMLGEPVHIKTPHSAMKHGIGMVHQEFMLIPGFTITENIKLNREIPKDSVINKYLPADLKILDYDRMSRDARKALDTLDMNIEEYVRVDGLPIGHMQFIEIAREIDKEGIRILVFDEPTAVLTESETENLLKAIKTLSAKGIGILFISHRLSEIVAVADKVSILRDGELIVTKAIPDTNVLEIAELMVGRKVEIVQKTPSEMISDEIIMELKDLYVDMPGELVKGINIKVKKGEILGIGGLAGQGKLGIANGIMGIHPAKGEVTYMGIPVPLGDPKKALEIGLGFVSEDRKGVGLLLEESIADNIVFTDMQINDSFLYKFGPCSLQKSGEIKAHANKMIADLDIRCTSSAQYTGRLCGGIQQKVCIARALTTNPTLLFVSEPTRGIDIGAKKLILDLFLRLNRELGMTIIMTSSELAELKSICDEIAIICEGRIFGMLPPDAPDIEFGLMMSGHKESAKGGKSE